MAAMVQAIRLRSSLRLVIGIFLTIGAIYLLSRQVDWRLAFRLMAKANWGWLALTLVSASLNDVAKAARWRSLLPPEGPAPPFWDVYGVYMSGRLLNAILPFRSGDITRAYLMGGRRGGSSATVMGSIGAEKWIDLLMLGSIAFLVLPNLVLPAELQNSNNWWIGLLASLVLWSSLILLSPRIQRLLAALQSRYRFTAPLCTLISRVLDGFNALRNTENLKRLFVFSLLILLTALLNNIFVLNALNLEATLFIAAIILVVIQFGVSVPTTLGQIGVFEWLAILALRLADVPAEQALAFGLLLHVIVLLPPLLVGLPWLIYRA